MDARRRQYETMENALANVNSRMVEAKSKSETIVNKVMQLEAALENDKQKWRSLAKAK